jgi:hypothetical protein
MIESIFNWKSIDILKTITIVKWCTIVRVELSPGLERVGSICINLAVLQQ